MSETCISAIDLAKDSFQVCGVGLDGGAVFHLAVSRGRLARLLSDQSPGVVAMEVGATSHHRGGLPWRMGMTCGRSRQIM